MKQYTRVKDALLKSYESTDELAARLVHLKRMADNMQALLDSIHNAPFPPRRSYPKKGDPYAL